MHLNRELEDTNRGVVALYAELDEKADHLRRADELKSRFLSNMTHEFRTPVNSIIGLTRLLIDDRQRDGREPEPELHLHPRGRRATVASSSTTCSISPRSKRARSPVRPADFEVENAVRRAARHAAAAAAQSVGLAGLRGRRRSAVGLHGRRQGVADSAQPDFECAEVHRARRSPRHGAAPTSADMMIFTVADTGIGIATEDQPRIFEEFTQLEHRLQRRCAEPASDFRCRGGSRSCSAARSRSGASSGSAPRSRYASRRATRAPRPVDVRLGARSRQSCRCSSSRTRRSAVLLREGARPPRSRSIRHERSSKPTTRSSTINPAAVILDIVLGQRRSLGHAAANEARRAPQPGAGHRHQLAVGAGEGGGARRRRLPAEADRPAPAARHTESAQRPRHTPSACSRSTTTKRCGF